MTRTLAQLFSALLVVTLGGTLIKVGSNNANDRGTR